METTTGGFKQVLGSGSSGVVYKGVIGDHSSKKLVAVKVLEKMHEMEGHDVREFTTEVTIIGETNHKNLARLVGFCDEGQHRLLVYEFMSNGSLADLLFRREVRPNWYTRTQIAYSIARGLAYLHEECITQIIHCDIKPQNILLDDSMTAKISDFGISKLMKANQTRTTTAIRGTKGYLAPEWFRNVPVTAKVDVHSFGILLLELVCCRKNFMMEVEKEEEMVLVDWAYDCYCQRKLHKLVEEDKEAMEDMKRVERFVKVGIWCIQEDPSLRPGMKKVVHMLEGAVLVSKPPDPRRWPAEWTALSFTPADICGLMRADTGSGACGFNSYCQIEDAQFPNCKCPNGYKFLDPSDESRGCLKTFPPQDCSSSAGEEDGQFDLVEMVNTIFPSGDYEYYQSISEDMCRDLCLSDCLCDAVTYESASCWKKRAPLTNGYMDQENTGKTLLKIRRQNSTYSTAGERKKNDQSRKLMATAGWVLLGSSVFVNLMFIVGSCPWRKKNRRMNRVGDESDEAMESANLQRFTYREMESATGGFKQVLGSGASGTVYKGVLGERAGELVAVKVLDNMPERDGHDVREFATEVKIIGGTNHKNLVKLVGYCNEGQHLLLVYEFMSNGSLADSLFGGGEGTFPRPNWYTRTQIAYSVARGLVYLHDECSTQIIHCDIKPQNILLDQGMTARISDFGISKLMKTDQTRTTTAIRGTKGYLAPEWFRNVPVTAKVDVHSFGIVLLELVCCRKSFLLDFEKEEEMVLVDWAYDCYSRGKLYKLVEKDEDAMEDLKKVERFVKVALWCIQEDPSLRPGMKKVVHMLEGAVLVSEPPDPSSFMSAI
ncbi:unnamed protein product [Linum tenue]|uniref:non-specific serine/threonine protein kinase n=1 Tax=Linum tenue TaxID=586396 RepID=A0AAV0MVF5_9ROSI|nr:unnamed protein product [Linum tenue]